MHSRPRELRLVLRSPRLQRSTARDEATTFSLRVLRHIASNDGGSRANLVVSPLSLHSTLVLLDAGARGATRFYCT
jgi:serine protease inhibitor